MKLRIMEFKGRFYPQRRRFGFWTNIYNSCYEDKSPAYAFLLRYQAYRSKPRTKHKRTYHPFP